MGRQPLFLVETAEDDISESALPVALLFEKVDKEGMERIPIQAALPERPKPTQPIGTASQCCPGRFPTDGLDPRRVEEEACHCEEVALPTSVIAIQPVI